VAYSKKGDVFVQLLKVPNNIKRGVQVFRSNESLLLAQASQQFNTVYHHDATCHPSNITRSKPAYALNTFGLLVNVQQGAILTEARGIFIQNLNYRCTALDLVQLLLTVANPVDVKLIRDSRTGIFKGSATALFATEEEASKVIKNLQGIEHMGMTLSTRQDKEPMIVQRYNEPLIVSGDGLKRREGFE
jgi:hypothetical protein